jgi:hypothetical protein
VPHTTTIPDPAALLCEKCGYDLTGLPESGNCPECGTPVADSLGENRAPPAWEQRPSPATFLSTTAAALFRPRRFYKTFSTRHQTPLQPLFAHVHWAVASLLLGTAATFHLAWYMLIIFATSPRTVAYTAVLAEFAFVAGCYVAVVGTTALAGRLTAWEAAYRGYRLPGPIVMRGLHYHAAHYLPIGLGALLTTGGYFYLTYGRGVAVETASAYLYTLSAGVIVAAFYLFETYWIGMRNMMYANR